MTELERLVAIVFLFSFLLSLFVVVHGFRLYRRLETSVWAGAGRIGRVVFYSVVSLFVFGLHHMIEVYLHLSVYLSGLDFVVSEALELLSLALLVLAASGLFSLSRSRAVAAS